jgi:outer membrane receptor protein involved in Fe transport
MIGIDQKITATAPSSDIAGTIYNPAKWRGRGHVGWTKSGLSLDAFVNVTGSYRNTLVAPSQKIGSWTTLDGQIGYRFNDASPLKGARIALSATNLLNTRPPYVDYGFANVVIGYDPNSASAVGREISLDLTFQW